MELYLLYVIYLQVYLTSVDTVRSVSDLCRYSHKCIYPA